METIYYNGQEINYIIKKKGTKNLYARLDKNNVLIISIPRFITKKSIEKFVVESYFKLISKKKNKKSILNDGKIKILGKLYDEEEITDLNYMLINGIKNYLKDNYLIICSRIGVSNPPSVVLKKVKGYLGQYNKKKNQITLNILIGHLDEECIEYVIVHELSHIKFMNHQKDFWREVEKVLPTYKRIRLRCKKEFVYYENY